MISLSYSLRGHQAAISSVAGYGVENHNAIIASGDETGEIIIWDQKTRRKRLKWKAHINSILEIFIYSPEYLLSQGRDNVLKFWKFSCTTSNIFVKLVFEFPIESLHFCKFNTFRTQQQTSALEENDCNSKVMLGHCNSSNNISIMQVSKKTLDELYFKDNAHNYESMELLHISSFDPIGRHGSCTVLSFVQKDIIIAGYEDGSLVKFSKSTSSLLSDKHQDVVLALAVSDRNIISAGADEFIIIHDSIDFTSRRIPLVTAGVSALIRLERDVVVICGWDGAIRVLDYNSSSQKAVFTEHSKSLRCAATFKIPLNPASRLSLDSISTQWLCIGAEDFRISVWAFS